MPKKDHGKKLAETGVNTSPHEHMKPRSTNRRRQIHFESAEIYNSFCEAIDRDVIRSDDASDRISKLVLQDVKRHAPKMEAAGIAIPAEVYK